MNPTTIIHAGGGLVKNSNNELLLIYRNHRWDLPKGKLESNETIETCALREVCEECGLSPASLSISHFLLKTSHNYTLNNENIEKITHWYAMNYLGNHQATPQIEEGITQARWHSKEEASELLESSYPTIREVFACYSTSTTPPKI